MPLMNYSNKCLKRWEIKVPIRYNSARVNDDIHDSWLEFNIKNDIVLQEFIDRISADGNIFKSNASIKLQKDTGKNAILIIANGLLEVGEFEVFEKFKALVKNLPLALTLEMNISNRNIHNYQPKVEIDYDKICLSGSNFFEKDNEVLNYGIGTEMRTSMIVNHDRLIKIFDSIQNKTDTKILNTFINGLGENDLNSKFYNLFAVIEIIEKQYVDFSLASQVISADGCAKLSECVDSLMLEDDERNSIKSAVIGAAKKVTNLSRAAKLCNILHGKFGIITIEYRDKLLTVDEKMCKDLINHRRKLFHGGSADNSKLKQSVDYLILIDMAIIKNLYLGE